MMAAESPLPGQQSGEKGLGLDLSACWAGTLLFPLSFAAVFTPTAFFVTPVFTLDFSRESGNVAMLCSLGVWLESGTALSWWHCSSNRPTETAQPLEA